MDFKAIPDLENALREKRFPTMLMWNRLEGRPRTHDFNKALKAEVRDALWMLTRQWQMGEFNAEDAGSPVFAKVHMCTSKLNTFKTARNDAESLDPEIPMEVSAEQRNIAFTRKSGKVNIDLRLQMGRYWLKLIRSKNLDFGSDYIKNYGFELPDQDKNAAGIYAHKDVWQKYAAISGRCMDGFLLYDHIKKGNKASDDLTATDSDKDALNLLGDDFYKWFEKQYQQPSNETTDAWLPERMEYQFESAAKTESGTKVLKATEYYSGHLDWFSFDLERTRGADETKKACFTNSFIPAQVEFDGMPNTRWWQFEDGKTDFGDIKPSTIDISKVLLMEFGLVYANDWFLVPVKLPIGSLVNVRGLTVTNNFGDTFWIESAERSHDLSPDWSMFKMRSQGFDDTTFLAPSAVKVQESEPIEEVQMIRDEMSNMVWGIETIVPDLLGNGEKGNEMALQTRSFYEKLVALNPDENRVDYAAKISYLAMTDVPENWIPFVPVHVPGSNRQVQLQRGSLLRIIAGDPDKKPVKIKPVTSILREGLDAEPAPLPFYMPEEEVPRTAIKVTQSFQRTRWTNGEVFVWLGMKKTIGRGEGSSGLAFDQISL